MSSVLVSVAEGGWRCARDSEPLTNRKLGWWTWQCTDQFYDDISRRIVIPFPLSTLLAWESDQIFNLRKYVFPFPPYPLITIRYPLMSRAFLLFLSTSSSSSNFTSTPPTYPPHLLHSLHPHPHPLLILSSFSPHSLLLPLPSPFLSFYLFPCISPSPAHLAQGKARNKVNHSFYPSVLCIELRGKEFRSNQEEQIKSDQITSFMSFI